MKRSESAIEEMVCDCLAVRVRLIARAVSAVYDHALEKEDVTIAQVNLLVALGKVGPCSPSKLGEVLQLERSTVSRNLDRLLKAGWIDALSSDAKGVKEVGLSPSGRKKIEQTLPQWRIAQREATKLLSASGAAAIREVAGNIWQ